VDAGWPFGSWLSEGRGELLLLRLLSNSFIPDCVYSMHAYVVSVNPFPSGYGKSA
jgi:hypothetical protein